MFCVRRAAALLVLSAAIFPQTATAAAACDIDREEKEIAEAMSASRNMTSAILQDAMTALADIDRLRKENKPDEACAVAAKVKTTIPK